MLISSAREASAWYPLMVSRSRLQVSRLKSCNLECGGQIVGFVTGQVAQERDFLEEDCLGHGKPVT